MSPGPLPTNGSDRTRVLVSLEGEIQNLASDAGLASVPVERTKPIREFYAWKNKRNYEGHWFSTTTGTHLRFESLLERQFLLTADFDQSVTAISAQPLALLWPAKTLSAEGKNLRSHVPDFFCRHTDGDGRLVDVRRSGHTDDPHFDLTAQLCAEIGWRYTIFSGLAEPTAANLTWLAGYRTRHFAPTESATTYILAAFTTGNTLRTGTQVAARRTQTPQNTILGNVLHLIFHGQLTFDSAQQLSYDSCIHTTTPEQAAP